MISAHADCAEIELEKCWIELNWIRKIKKNMYI